MGFLDDLKRKADALKGQQTQDLALLARNTEAAETACKMALQYWLELAPQLNVLQPTSPVRYSLDSRTAVDGLVRCDFRVDSRRKRLREQEVTDFVVLHGLQKSGRRMAMSKDFPPEVERLEGRLRQAGITPDTQTLRDPANGRLQEVRFAFIADFTLTLRLTPDHDAGTMRFQLANFDHLETLNIEFPASAVSTELMDELARWLTGESHRFLQMGGSLRRIES